MQQIGNESKWEIEEIVEETEAALRIPSKKTPKADGDEVYVAVGKSSSSMEALSWALKHVAKPSSILYLIHVFPEVHLIPTPLGKVPKNQVSPQQVEAYMDRERNKRRELLQKFLNQCTAFKGETLLIESNLVAKAIVDLIPVLHIKRLILGTTKFNIWNGKLKNGSNKAGQIYNNVPQYCAVQVICQGREVKAVHHTESSSRLCSGFHNTKENTNEKKNRNSSGCICFPKRLVL